MEVERIIYSSSLRAKRSNLYFLKRLLQFAELRNDVSFVTLSLSTLLKADLSKCEGIRSRLRQAQPDSKELKLTAEDKIEATLQNQLSNVTLSLSKGVILISKPLYS